MLNDLRVKYWIPRGRALVKKVLRDCPLCRRRCATPCQPRMADLPKARFDGCHPFNAVGTDNSGPLQIETGRRGTEKRYCLLITCMTTRAVHLEISRTLSTDSFLMASTRF